jgi:hypothetical protein
MKNMLRFILIFTFILATTAQAGSVKKWVDADGNVTFGDAPPPSVTNPEKVKVQEAYSPSAPSSTAPSSLPSSSSPSNSPATDDYYSPQNQLRRMKAQERQEKQERSQERIKKTGEEVTKIQNENYDPSKCAEYRAMADSIAKRNRLMYTSDMNWIYASQRISLYCFR